MNNLLYKEFRLGIHPSIYIFLSFGVLLLIPSWPFFIAFGGISFWVHEHLPHQPIKS